MGVHSFINFKLYTVLYAYEYQLKSYIQIFEEKKCILLYLLYLYLELNFEDISLHYSVLRAINVNLLIFTIISVAMNCSASFSFRVQMRLVSAVTLVEGGNQNSSLQAVALQVRLYTSCKLTPSIKSSEIWKSKNDAIHILKFYAFS